MRAVMSDGTTVSLSAADAQGREAFLAQFGWEIEPDPLAVKEVIIPARFNEVYAQYNELQKTQGFDLTALYGNNVKIWTYRVTNYPGATCDVVANLMIKDGRVVGGDISSTEQGGFMHGFDPTGAAAQTAMNQFAEKTIDRSVPDSIPIDSDALPEPDGEDGE